MSSIGRPISGSIDRSERLADLLLGDHADLPGIILIRHGANRAYSHGTAGARGVDARPDRGGADAAREPTPLEVHKALADDTRFRLYRYLGLSGRPVAGPRALDAPVPAPEHAPPAPAPAGGGRARPSRGPRGRRVGPAADHVRRRRASRTRGPRLPPARRDPGRARHGRARAGARAAGSPASGAQYLVGRAAARSPGRAPAGRPNLAVLQEAMARRGSTRGSAAAARRLVEVTLRDCPFRELLDDHRELVCADPPWARRGHARGAEAAARARVVRAPRRAGDLPARGRRIARLSRSGSGDGRGGR